MGKPRTMLYVFVLKISLDAQIVVHESMMLLSILNPTCQFNNFLNLTEF